MFLSILGFAAIAGVVAFIGFAAYVRLGPVPTAEDPLTTRPPTSPNWALAATEGVETAGAPTLRLAPLSASPEAVLAALTQAALAESGVVRADAADDPLRRDFVQRSALMAYPDVISARVVPLPPAADGAARSGVALYSRSIYGYSDLGVNAARIERWTAALAEAL